MAYTLATAAEAAKVTKPTVFRWIRSGKVSAVKAEDGSYRIDPAELHRYLDSVSKDVPHREPSQRADALPIAPADALQEALALRYEVEKLKALLDNEKQRSDELRAERDRWAATVERLALPAPETKRNVWSFFRRAG